jgi:hypothetical protein
MSVSGRIAIDVEFTDRTSTAAGSSLNTIALRDATEYTSGKVAIVTGTCGTAVTTIFEAGIATPYKNARGEPVTFALGGNVTRLAFSSRERVEFYISGSDFRVASEYNRISATCLLGGGADVITAQAMMGTAGTASYTLVLYGT